jgi:ribonuclease III
MTNEEFPELENRLGYAFRDKKVLLEALTHRSFYHENPDKADAYNERLEFLGDSVLGFIIVEYLFSINHNLTESVMAKTKSYVVKEAVLSEVASSISIGQYLRLGKGEEHTGGRTKKSLLADAFEALLGAVYVDGGYDAAQKIVLSLFREKIHPIINSGEFHDSKTELQEKTQLLFSSIPDYRIIKQEGEEHRKIFTVEVYISGEKYGSGVGKSKKEAETIAAKEALAVLQQAQ